MAVAIGDYTLTTQRVNQILETLAGDMVELFAIAAEVEAGRDGAASLLAQINTIQASITALSVGSGCPVSEDDASAGVLDTKILVGNASSVSAYTADDTLTASDMIGMTKTIGDPGGDETLTLAYGEKIISNTGAAGAVNLDLPAGATGLSFLVVVTVAQYLKFTADGTEKFRFGASTSAAGGYIRSNEVGNVFRVVWSGTDWNVIPMSDLIIYVDE